MTKKQFDLQGHRGCRGLMPENTLPGFIKALEIGVQTLEMDVVISADHKVVLSHDPYFSSTICLNQDGDELNDEKDYIIYNYKHEEIKKFDCGSKGNKEFPEQKKLAAYKPLLSEVIRIAEEYCLKEHRPLPVYNIETKTTIEGDNILHPEPKVFAELLYDVIYENGINERCIIQSFDVRTLQYMAEINSSVKLSLLVENELSASENIARLGFTPHIYSPDYRLMDKALIDFCSEKGIMIIPWTVNNPAEMQRLIELGVNGIITDYPNRFPFEYFSK